MLPEQILECKQCGELPTVLKQLLTHNFQADFVSYHKENQMLEIGVNVQEEPDAYPQINVKSFPLAEITKYLEPTFKHGDQDLKFYGKLIAGNGFIRKADNVVLV